MEAEILTSDTLPTGERYVRYAGWRDETRKAQGRGDHRFRRPDGGEIVADLLNDHKIQVPPLGRELVIRANGSPKVHHLPTDAWVDLLTYRGKLSDLEYRTWTIDVETEFVLPAISRFRQRLLAGGRWGDRTGTTLNLIVGASAGDADERQSDGSVSLTIAPNRTYSRNVASSQYHSGHHFTGATIPSGATINAATLTLNCTSTSLDDMYCTIHADDSDSAAAFTSTSYDIGSRTRTTASQSWQQDACGTGDEVSPDFASVVQEVVDRAGWASGNSIAILLISSASPPAIKFFASTAYDTSTTLCARLDIDYTAATGGANSNLLLLGVG